MLNSLQNRDIMTTFALIFKNMFNRLKNNKIVRRLFVGIVIIYAVFGFVLSTAYVAIKLHLTNDPGSIDNNNRYFDMVYNKSNAHKKTGSDLDIKEKAYLFYKIKVLSDYYPQNALAITTLIKQSGDFVQAERMFDAMNLQLLENEELQNKFAEGEKYFIPRAKSHLGKSLFPWMELEEWTVLREAIAKDSVEIYRAAHATGVEARLIVSCLVGEQIRLFNSARETFKKVLAPLKILSLESCFSYGVTGIKPFTACQVQRNLINKNSEYYLGEKYEHLLDFNSDTSNSQISYDTLNINRRLLDFRNHYFSYLYAGLILKQIKVQWERAGFDISDRPEILATLYNVGFYMSKPKADPQVGGSSIKVGDHDYTFGSIAYEFYYSGELADKFPYTRNKWTD